MVFDQWCMGTMRLRNRLVRSGTSEGASKDDGRPNDGLRRMYVDLARGGVGLIITGFAYIREDGRSDLTQNGIHKDELVSAWREITDAVHDADGQCKIAMQIVHGGRQCKSDSTAHPVAPSAVPDPRAGITPRELTPEEIHQLIDDFGQAARRVKEAGFDAVQLHAAHGYLLAQFNSPHTNRRTDEWGGNVEKRSRFFVEVLRRCRREVGSGFPILTKLNCTDFLPGGLTSEQAARIASILANEGIDGIELSAWMFEADPQLSPSRKVDPKPEEEGYFLNEARIVRRAVDASVPVGLCGGIRSASAINRLVTEEGFDFVALSRPFIAEPDLANRLESGQPRVGCDSCNECLEAGRDPVVKCPPILEGRLYQRIGHPEWA